MTSGPGQTTPNELEQAILSRLAEQDPTLARHLEELHVLSREFTGVGSFTRFLCRDSGAGTAREPLSLDALIRMPGAPSGMGAVLFFEGDRPSLLELHTYGDDHWEGIHDGFSLEEPS